MEKSAMKQTIFERNNVYFAIVFILMLGAHFIPPFGVITRVGVNLLGIFLGLLFGWSTMGMLLPSLLGIVFIGFSGVTTLSGILSMGFGMETIIFTIFIFILVQMLSDSGTVGVISDFIITRKAFQGRPWVLSFVILFAGSLLSAIGGQAFAAFFLFWKLMEDIFNKVGYQKFEMYPAIMLIGLIITSVSFGIAIPYIGLPYIIGNTFAAVTGQTINYGQHLLVMVPTGILLLLAYLVVCRFVFKPDVSKLKDLDMNQIVQFKGMTKHQQGVAWAFAFVLLCLIVPSMLPKAWAVSTLLSSIGSAGLMVMCCIIFSLIKIEDKPLLNFGVAARSAVVWDIIFMVMALLLMASLLTSDATGIKPFVIGLLSPLLAGTSALTFYILMFVISVILTQFMNNIVVGIIFLPIVASFAQPLGLNLQFSCALLIMATCTAFLTPAASPAAAVQFTKTDWVEKSLIFKIAAVSVVTFMVVGFISVFIFGGLVYGYS